MDAWKKLKSLGAIAAARKNVKVLENWPKIVLTFSQSAIEKQIGYIDKIEGVVLKHGITMEQFKELIQRPVEGIVNVPEGVKYLTKEEQSLLADIRLELIGDMDGSTVFEKTITEANAIERMGNEKYAQTIVGFISHSNDVKQLNTSEKAYYGLSMNYKGSTYNEKNTDWLIRFNADANEVKQKVTLSYPNEYPYTGNGFTKGGNGIIGIPELGIIKDNMPLKIKSAAILRRLNNGNLDIYAIFFESEGFIKIK